MFLVDSAAPEPSVEDKIGEDGISSAARKILEKAGAEIVSMKKWDERKLAYKIAGRDRGTYILCYFHADGQKIQQIERDAQLSEKIMRVLILAASDRETSGDVPDGVSDKEGIERDIASQSAAAGKKPDEVKADESRPVTAAADEDSKAAPAAMPDGKRGTVGRKRRTENAGEETA
jgi:small subunit ribosomal protein S6